MGVLRDTIGGRRQASPAKDAFGSEPATQEPGTDSQATAVPPLLPPAAASSNTAAPPEQRSELRSRRDALAEQVAELHWDLGGLAYEMAIRDHFRLDVLVRRAAILQERDAELAEVERLLRTEEGGAVGACPSCAAPHSRGALYCWQCGSALMERMPSSAMQTAALAPGEQVTEGIDALLTPRPEGLADPAHEDL